MLPLRAIFASIILLLAATGTVVAENRIALVIGNSAYRTVSVLPNPTNDANAVTELLSTAGFEVINAPDLTQNDMRRAVRDFSAKVAEKGPDTVALIFYAGHGLQVDGENFLVPVDARIEREGDVAIETMRLADIMSALASTPSRMRIVILDSCRNNPFSAVSAGGKGLAMVDAPAGSIVAYATAPGTEALDGSGRHSPYTAALIKTARQPNLPIEQMFKRVRLLVHESTDSQQTPWESSSLTGDFAFFTGTGAPSGDASTAPKALTKVASWRDEIRTRSPREAYELVVMEDSVEAYEEYVLVYPSDPWSERIRRLLRARAESAAWRYAVLQNNAGAYANYLSSFPGGIYAKSALRLQERPRVRPVDPVFMPKVVIAPKPLRVTLPQIQQTIKQPVVNTQTNIKTNTQTNTQTNIQTKQQTNIQTKQTTTPIQQTNTQTNIQTKQTTTSTQQSNTLPSQTNIQQKGSQQDPKKGSGDPAGQKGKSAS
ncbi:MAG: caspase family protein, partial [Rhizobiales bacterium]|nr:caspase family protein [Hyphomicrobiales bacterium]